jgi:outer membrane lipoprotein
MSGPSKPAVMRILALLLSALLLTACAAGPRFDSRAYSQSPTPAEAAVDPALWRDSRVLWGGMILNSVNHEDGTEIEVLAYPLAGGQRPDTSRQPIGRFIVHKDAYLETIHYAQGRLVTVAGPFTSTRDGRVGDARFTWPLVEADGIHLWARDSAATRREPQFSIGVGILLGR